MKNQNGIKRRFPVLIGIQNNEKHSTSRVSSTRNEKGLCQLISPCLPNDRYR